VKKWKEGNMENKHINGICRDCALETVKDGKMDNEYTFGNNADRKVFIDMRDYQSVIFQTHLGEFTLEITPDSNDPTLMQLRLRPIKESENEN